MEKKHKYISYSSGIYKASMPLPLMRELGLTDERIGRRNSLEAALEIRDKFFAEHNISHLLVDPVEDHEPTFKDEGDTATASVRGSRVDTVEALLEHCEVDTKIWEVDKQVINCWDVTNGDGETFQNFQVKAWLKRKFHEIDTEYLLELVKDMPKAKPVVHQKKGEKNLLEISIFDLHLGKLCWAPEVGSNYDLSIARQKFMTAIMKLISLSTAYSFEKILFPIGSDFFNIDNLDATTTAGTPQQMEGRYPKMVATGVALIIEAIDILRQIAPVEVVNIPGNHDRASDYWLAHLIRYRYDDDSAVFVDDSPRRRKAFKFYDCMINLAHGDGPKRSDWPGLAASEYPEIWGTTTFREYHLGHFHHEMVKEHPGIVIRWLNSLSPADLWHDGKGFTSNREAATAFVWSKGEGMNAQFTCNV